METIVTYLEDAVTTEKKSRNQGKKPEVGRRKPKLGEENRSWRKKTEVGGRKPKLAEENRSWRKKRSSTVKTAGVV